MSDLQELITQYKLSKTGDKNAIRCILSNMGDGKFLKSDLSFELMCLLQLAEQSDESAYKTLYTLKQVDSENEPLYFEPDYIKEEKKIVEEAQILAEAKAWKDNMLAKKASEEEEARKAEIQRIKEEEIRQKEREIESRVVERLKQDEGVIEAINYILKDMIYIEGGSYEVYDTLDNKESPHLEFVEGFWMTNSPLDGDDARRLKLNNSQDTSIVQKYVHRFSEIAGGLFELPTSIQLGYAVKNIFERKDVSWVEFVKGPKPVRIDAKTGTIHNGANAYQFRLVCSESVLSKIKDELKAIEERKNTEELRRQEEIQKSKEEEKQRIAQAKEARRLAKIEAEEKERQLQEQKELELVEHLKTMATETISKIVRDMVFIEGGNALLGNVNNSSNPAHVENIESFWIKKHSITKDEMENLLVEYSISSDNTSKFVQRLSKVTDCVFDIPTSAQLEYAMKAKDKNYVPSSPFSQIGDDRIIKYGSLSEIVKDSKVLVVKDFYKLVFSLESKTSAESFRIVCSDAKLRDIKEELVRVEEEFNKKAKE